MKFSVIMLIGWWGWVGSLQAATWYVAPNGDDSANNGTGGWAQAYATISNAVAHANTNAGDWVLISNGTYTLTATNLFITNAISVRSWHDGAVDRENTLISGGGAVRGFIVNHTGAVVEGVTVTNGAAPNSYGGGIYLASGLVTNCVLSGNWATNGGGISLHSANAIVKNSLIAGNTASNGGYYTGGGGLWMSAGLVTNCVISNNVALHSGGGADVSGGKLTDSVIVTNRTLSAGFGYGGGGVMVHDNSAAALANCTIVGNANGTAETDGGGGGVAVINGGLVTNCVIAYNWSGRGGGAYFQGNNTRLVDCVISNNTANTGGGVLYYNNGVVLNCRVVENKATTGNGGGIRHYSGGAPETMNTLVAGNSAAGSGGGIYAQGDRISSCTIVSNYSGSDGSVMFANYETLVTNSIIVSNRTGGAWSNIAIAIAGNVTASLYYCCTPNTNGLNMADRVVTDPPRFVDFIAGNFRLGPNSPCINAGTNAAWMETANDLLGRPRIYYGRSDIGCYEYFLDVKVNGIPIDRIKSINGIPKHRIIRINL